MCFGRAALLISGKFGFFLGFFFLSCLVILFKIEEWVTVVIIFSLQGSDVDVEVPANLSMYMEALLAFTTHSSQVRCLKE